MPQIKVLSKKKKSFNYIIINVSKSNPPGTVSYCSLEGDVRGLASLSNGISSCEPDYGRLGMKKGDYNGWLLSYGRSASHRSNHFLSCGMLGKLGVALRGVSGCVSAHSGEFSSDNTVSGHTHTGRFGEIVDRRQNIALSPSRAYGLRGSNLCDICDKVLWLSITFNCRT